MTTDETIQPDRLELMIGERLGERRRKLERMDAWERKARRQRLGYAAMAIAACAAIAIVAAPFMAPTPSPLDALGIEYSTTEYRAASTELTEIERLITNHQYDEALSAAESMIEEIKTNVTMLGIIAENEKSDELDYEVETCECIISELRWARIYLLARTEQYDCAKKELRTYLKDKRHCEHRAEAEQLLTALKEKDEKNIHRWVTFYKLLLK